MADGEPDKRDLDSYTMLLADELMVASAQRPGAVANMRVREWRHREREGNVTIIRVHDHKTSAQGPALLILTPEREAALERYYQLVRPLLNRDPKNKGVFFLLSSGRVIERHTQRVRALCQQFGVTHHTSTQVRKSVQTMVAKKLTTEDQAVVNRQLGHSSRTAEQFYQLDRTRKDAAKAFELIGVCQSGLLRGHLGTQSTPNVTHLGQM